MEKAEGFESIVIENKKSQNIINKNFLFYDGDIKLKSLDMLIPYFCLVDVIKQKLILYTENKKQKTVYFLKQAKVEEGKENDFLVILNGGTSSGDFLNIICESAEITQRWIEFIERAIQINRPETIELKIEPIKEGRLLSFYCVKD